MAEYSSVAIQTINPGESVIFTTTTVPCNRGLVMHRESSGIFILSGWSPNTCGCGCCNCGGARYLCQFGANIAIPTGGTVEEIQVAFSLEGATLPESIMRLTPAAAEEYGNISRAISVPVFRGCCESFAIRNISSQPILMQNANLIITRPDLAITR